MVIRAYGGLLALACAIAALALGACAVPNGGGTLSGPTSVMNEEQGEAHTGPTELTVSYRGRDVTFSPHDWTQTRVIRRHFRGAIAYDGLGYFYRIDAAYLAMFPPKATKPAWQNHRGVRLPGRIHAVEGHAYVIVGDSGEPDPYLYGVSEFARGNGAYLRTYMQDVGDFAIDVAVDTSGNIYVLAGGGYDYGPIVEFAQGNLVPIRQFESRGTAIALDPSGVLYVGVGSSVHEYSPGGATMIRSVPFAWDISQIASDGIGDEFVAGSSSGKTYIATLPPGATAPSRTIVIAGPNVLAQMAASRHGDLFVTVGANNYGAPTSIWEYPAGSTTHVVLPVPPNNGGPIAVFP